MAKETAIVIGTTDNYAIVKTIRTEGCAACSERNLCHTMGGGKDLEFLATNPVNAKQGDTVLLDFKSLRLLQLSFLLYIFPIIVLVAGAVTGDAIAPSYGIDKSAGAASLGFAGFFIAIGIILLLERKAKNSDRYKPVILTVKKSTPPPSTSDCCGHKPHRPDVST